MLHLGKRLLGRQQTEKEQEEILKYRKWMWAIVFLVFLLIGVWGYNELFAPKTVVENYLKNQFSYNSETVEAMQERRKAFLNDEMLLLGQSSGTVEERKTYALSNKEQCILLDMVIEKEEKGKYFFEVWYCLRYDTFEVDDKRMHVNGVIEVERAEGITNKISSIEVMHGCEEIVEKEYKR